MINMARLDIEVRGRKKTESKSGGMQTRLELTVQYVILGLLSLVFLVPFYWMFSESIKTPSEIFEVPARWAPRIPQWHNYVRLLSEFPFLLFFRNTMVVVAANIIGSVFSNSLIAYGFSRIDWKHRDKVFVLVIITMILPFQVTMIPLFLLFQKMHWIGTFLPLTVTAFFGNSFFIFLIRQFFIGIPKELSYSAKVDGANEFRTYWSIIMPLAKPALTTVVIFAFLRSWNDFIGPLIFLSNDKLYTLSLGAQSIISDMEPKWDILMTLGVVMTAPVLILFFVLQKYFIQGIALSGIKG
jgi:multiple sugar transport system permease protein